MDASCRIPQPAWKKLFHFTKSCDMVVTQPEHPMKRLSFVAFACLLISHLSLRAASPVVISEFMASNTRALQDETGDYPDWIEIQNLTSNTVNLLNWSLTDSAGDLAKWRFPANKLAAGQIM